MQMQMVRPVGPPVWEPVPVYGGDWSYGCTTRLPYQVGGQGHVKKGSYYFCCTANLIACSTNGSIHL